MWGSSELVAWNQFAQKSINTTNVPNRNISISQLAKRPPAGGLVSSIIKYLGTRVFLKGMRKLTLDLPVSAANRPVFLEFTSVLKVTNCDQLCPLFIASAFCRPQRLE